MIAYMDTSAMVKLYLSEPGSEASIRLWRESQRIAVSAVGYAELVAAFQRKRREGIVSREGLTRAIRSFKSDWESVQVVPLSPQLNRRIDRLVADHPLRGFDAIHLASALAIRDAVGEEFLLVSADRRLLDAAQKEGLNVYPDRSW